MQADLLQGIAAALPLAALIVSFLGGVGGLLSLLIVERRKATYLQDLERVKADLARDTEVARAELTAIAFEHQTRFSRLHERRVEVIADLYRRLVITEVAFNAAFLPLRRGRTVEDIQTRVTQEEQAAADASNDFVEYFQQNRLWLDRALCVKVEMLAETFRAAWYQYNNLNAQQGQATERGEAWRRVRIEVPSIRGEIENSMRTMLGALDPPN
jgi:hypothetical protein